MTIEDEKKKNKFSIFVSQTIKYFLVGGIGVGVNLVKNPNISNYPTTNLNELVKKKVTTKQIIRDLNYIYKIFLKSYRVI